MGVLNWLMKGIGFEGDEEVDEQSLALAEQKRLYKENKRQEKLANKIRKQEEKNMSFAKFNVSPEPSEPEEEVYKPRVIPTETTFSAANNENMQTTYAYDNAYNGYVQTSMSGYAPKNVIFFYPKKYSEVQKLIDHLRQGETLMLNLDNISDEEAQRMLDFASGAVYALSGSIKRVSGNIFILTPEGYGIISSDGEHL